MQINLIAYKFKCSNIITIFLNPPRNDLFILRRKKYAIARSLEFRLEHFSECLRH